MDREAYANDNNNLPARTWDGVLDAHDVDERERWAVVILPPKETADDTLAAAEALFRSVHGEFDDFAFEIEQRPSEEIVFRYVCGEHARAERLQQLIVSAYPNVEAHVEPVPSIIADDDAVAIARVGLEQDYQLPIRHAHSAESPETDPYRAFIDTIDAADGRAMVQTVVEPVDSPQSTRWARGLPYERDDPAWWKLPIDRSTRWDSLDETIAVTLLTAGGWWLVTQYFAIASLGINVLFVGLGLVVCGLWWTSLFGHHHYPGRMTTREIAELLRTKAWSDAKATRGERHTAEMIAERAQRPAFRVTMRLVAIADEPASARELRDRLGEQLRAAYHDPITGQRLRIRPVRGNGMASEFERLTARSPATDRMRTWAAKARFAARRRYPMVIGMGELAALAHLPDKGDIWTNKIRWTTPHDGDGVPIGMPRFDFAALGLEEASRAEKQLALFDSSAPGEPIWYGWGAKMGTEAGLFPHNLDAHQFAGGATRVGKTTFLINFTSQLFRRGAGGLMIDPKGADADDFIREWPEDRPEEDLIVIDLSTDPDGNEWPKIPRFNPLEVSEENKDSDIEKIASNITAMVSESGADDKYLGSVMKRVTKTIARGMARSGKQATILDLACAGSEPENLEKFADWMDDEQIDFIRDTARRLSEAELNLDPLAGRFDEWLHNPSIRNLITARNPSFSIQDAVDNDKWIIVRFDENASDSEKRLISLPLLARTESAKKISDNDDPYYVICDEFDDIATDQTKLHKTLSKAGAHHYRLTMSCQAPANQLPSTLRKAVENQCETFITFNPRGKDDVRFVAHKHTIGKDAISGLSKYRMFMRSHDRNDDFTDSYLVNAFPPISKVREQVTGVPGRSDEAVLALKRRSMERYGKPNKTAAEQRRDGIFYDDHVEGAASAELDHANALKALEDTAIRSGNPGGSVPIADALGRLGAYLGGEFTDVDDVWRAVLQEIPETQLEYGDADGAPESVRVKDRAWLDVGTSTTAGGREHSLLLADAYQPLTQVGFVVDVVDQSTGRTNESLPDGIADPSEALSLDGLDPAEDASEIYERVREFRTSREHAVMARLTDVRRGYLEAEHSTTETQPSQAIVNAIGAHNDGARCLYLVRPENAARLHGYLADEPAGARSNHDVANERRFYNAGTITIDGEDMTRPGGRENIWVYDERAEQYILRDREGTEHARFDSAKDIFTDADAYPGGERTVRRPLIPEHELDDGDMSDVEFDILIVPHPEVVDGERRRLTPFDIKIYQSDSEPVPLIDVPKTPDAHTNGAHKNGNGGDEESLREFHDALDVVLEDLGDGQSKN